MRFIDCYPPDDSELKSQVLTTYICGQLDDTDLYVDAAPS